MDKSFNDIYRLNENEIVDGGPIKGKTNLKIECYNNDGILSHTGNIENVSRMLLFNTDNGINICLHFPVKNIAEIVSASIPDMGGMVKYEFSFESLFGPAILYFQTATIPVITKDALEILKHGKYPEINLYDSIMFHTDNNLSLTINGRLVDNKNLKKMLVFSDGKDLEKDPVDTCRELISKMSSDSWFDSIKKENVMESINSKKNKVLKTAEEKMMQSKRDKIANSVSDSVATPQSGNVFDTISLVVKSGSKTPIADLDKMVGLEKVKKSIKRLYYKQQFDNSLKVDSGDTPSLHMCFLGNPGTGKTTVARIITGILYEMKLIKNNRCVEINGLDLIGNYVGQTGIITKKIIDASRGGVLFIDEAYALNSSSNPYGPEAVSVLLKEMEDNRGDVVVILAGYNGPMNAFLDMNSGFRSRINRYFEFEDYTPDELFSIFGKELKERGYSIDVRNLPSILSDFYVASKGDNFSNGRYIRNYVERLEDKHIEFVINDLNSSSPTINFDKNSDNFIRKIHVSI